MTDLVLFVLIFLVAGAGLLLAPLMMGRLVRPHRPSPEKGAVYECGEPTIGSAWVQFDLRFYVVALLFVIFDVELAFFFPWAVVFGSANRLGDETLPPAQRYEAAAALHPGTPQPVVTDPSIPPGWGEEELKLSSRAYHVRLPEAAPARRLAWVAFADILVFFGVLLVGFAYLWRRGDLAWVRSTAAQDQQRPGTAVPGPAEVVHGNA